MKLSHNIRKYNKDKNEWIELCKIDETRTGQLFLDRRRTKLYGIFDRLKYISGAEFKSGHTWRHLKVLNITTGTISKCVNTKKLDKIKHVFG